MISLKRHHFLAFLSQQLESESDIDVSDIGSVHIYDFSDCSDAEGNFTGIDSDNSWSEMLRPFDIPEFCERTGASIDDFAAENAAQIDFFHLLFTP